MELVEEREECVEGWTPSRKHGADKPHQVLTATPVHQAEQEGEAA